MNLKDRYNRYKISDWLTLIIGIVICVIQIFRYAYDKLGSPSIEIVVAGVWLLLILAPKTINDLIRKIKGLDK